MTSWPVHVEMLEDESISSWLVRSALENGCDPLVLTGSMWPDRRIWTTDIDRGIPEERLESISAASDIGKLSIQRAALSHEACLLSPRGIKKHGVWPWVQGLGARNRRYRGGVQYCPCCLSGDLKPYFRRHWRFSWSTGCLRHNVRLIDSCPQCSKPVEPHRLEAIQSVRLSLCASCGFDLRQSPSEEALRNAQDFQLCAFSVVSSKTGEMAGTGVRVDEWFEACRHLIGLLRRSANSPGSILALALKDVGVDVRLVARESLSLQLELLPVVVRSNLLACLDQLLPSLELFAASLRERGASANCVWGRERYLPSALRLLTEQLVQAERPKTRGRQRARGKPRSTVTVLKAWARLKRKYGIE